MAVQTTEYEHLKAQQVMYPATFWQFQQPLREVAGVRMGARAVRRPAAEEMLRTGGLVQPAGDRVPFSPIILTAAAEEQYPGARSRISREEMYLRARGLVPFRPARGLGAEAPKGEAFSTGLQAALPSVQKSITGVFTAGAKADWRADKARAQQLLVDLGIIAEGLATGTDELVTLLNQGYSINAMQATEADIALVNTRRAAVEAAKNYLAIIGAAPLGEVREIPVVRFVSAQEAKAAISRIEMSGIALGRTEAQKLADRKAWLTSFMSTMQANFTRTDANLNKVCQATGLQRVTDSAAGSAWGIPTEAGAAPASQTLAKIAPVAPAVVKPFPTALVVGGTAGAVLFAALIIVLTKKK